MGESRWKDNSTGAVVENCVLEQGWKQSIKTYLRGRGGGGAGGPSLLPATREVQIQVDLCESAISLVNIVSFRLDRGPQ